ncbi:MAG: alpha/beta fold hydrolase [Deltaproteobacteria bacterium]
MPKIDLSGVNFNYSLDGRGDEAIVFINGLTMTLEGWYLQAAALAPRYQILRYDCRGQGLSDSIPPEYSQQMHAEDLSALMDKLQIGKAHIAGISNGGMIAQHFALAYPEKVRSLILTDTCSHVETLLELMLKAWIRATEVGGSALRYDVALPTLFAEGFVKRNLQSILNMRELNIKINSPQNVISLAKASMRHNLSDRVSQIRARTLIIVGEEDILIPPRYSQILHEKIKNSELLVIRDCGHVPPLEKPEEFNRALLGFLAG